MKVLITKALILSVFTFSQFYSFGSVSDPAVAYAGINPSPILIPTNVSVSLTLVNLGTTSLNSDAVNIHISLSGLRPSADFDLARNISGEGSDLFDWVYDRETNSFTGTLNCEWSFARGGSVQISNLDCIVLSLPGNESVGLNAIVIAPDEINASKSNDSTNAYTSSSVTVSSNIKEGVPAMDLVGPEVQHEDEPATFYPNPVKERLVIRNAGPCEIRLLNTKGELIYQSAYSDECGVDMRGFPSGIYVVKITGRNGLIRSGKVLKE